MENEKFEFNVSERTQEVIIREGEAPKVFDPIKYDNNGISVGTLFNYVDGNIFLEKLVNHGILTYGVQPKNMHLKFNADVNDPLATELKAALVINNEYLDFKINTDEGWQGEQLIKFVRQHAHCFAELKAPEALIKALQNFEVKFEQVHKENDDRKGNTDKSIKTALKFVAGEVPLEWKLRLPMFKGTPPVEFVISIEIESRHGFPMFAFYSLEAEMLFRTSGEELIRAEVKKFEPHFVCLETI